MSKVDENFPHEIYSFIHRPIRDLDQRQGFQFLERFLTGAQNEFENMQGRINTVKDILNPSKTRADLLQFLKDHVGFTKELNNITAGLPENDLRKLIKLAVALFKQKGTEVGYINIVRLFTGKTARVFNWFDFRLIVGEKAFGEEQLDQDVWLISVPGVIATSDKSNNVVSLLTFEGNVKDRSINKNDATIFGSVFFFNTPAAGFPIGSDKFIKFAGGIVKQPHTVKYDMSGSFTIEKFIRPTLIVADQVLFNKSIDGVEVKITLNTTTNTISFDLDDGPTAISGSLIPTFTMSDGVNRHVALMIDRDDGSVRLWVGATLGTGESTNKIALGILGDLTSLAPIILGGSTFGTDLYSGDMDNFRLALNKVYDIDDAAITPPLVGFIEFQEERLDEFFSDIRIVDEGDLNKTLILRILNLMRPVSERLNVIFIRFFADFIEGSGQFDALTGSLSVNVSGQMVMPVSTIAATNVLGDSEFKDIVLQVKMRDSVVGGGIFSILFFVQDSLNFYEFRINTILRESALFKVVAGVETQIGADISFNVPPQTNQFFTITTDFNTTTSETQIKTYIARNLMHKVVDPEFEKGKFGMKTDASTTALVDEVEMFEMPVDIQQILPGFSL